MKKTLALLLALLMVATLFACTPKTEEPAVVDPTPAVEEPTVDDADVDVDVPEVEEPVVDVPEVEAPVDEEPVVEAPVVDEPADAVEGDGFDLAAAFPVGTWPLDAGTYDPALDGQGIPDGAVVYGLFAADYSTIADPTAVAGYTQVDDIAALAAGNYFLLVGSSGFNYIIVVD